MAITPNKPYSYFKTQVLLNLQNRGADPNTVNIVLTNFNFVQDILTRLVEWEDLETTTTPNLVINKNTYNPDDLGFSTMFHKIYNITLFADSKWYPPMSYLTPNKWDYSVKPLTTLSVGKPYIWTKWGKQVTFYKTPDQTYPLSIRATTYAAPIVNDTDLVSFFSIDSLLINLTTAYSWLSLGERDLSMTYFRIATNLMKSYDQDLNQLLNFVSASEVPVTTIQNYWVDPFVKKMP